MEKPASLKEKKNIFRDLSLVCGIATILKVKSIAFRCPFFFFLVRLAHLRISEPFHLKAFFFKEIYNFHFPGLHWTCKECCCVHTIV